MFRIFLLLTFTICFAIKSYAACKKGKALRVFFGETSVPPYGVQANAKILSMFNAAVLGQLLTTDSNFNLKPGLIETFYFDFEQRKYVLKLRDNIKFHNGRRANSSDLEFSLVRGFFTPQKSFYHTYLGNVEGVEKIKTGGQFTSGSVSGIQIVDTRTLTIKLKAPNPSFLHALTNPYFSLVPIEKMNSDYISWEDYPVGAGPYKVESAFDGSKTTLIVFDKSNEDLPSCVDIYQKHEKLEYDISFERLNYLQVRPTNLPIGVRMLQINKENVLGRDKHFRAGLRFLFDRSHFANIGKEITPIDQILPKHFWGRVDDRNTFDLAEAKKLFDKIPKDLREKTWEIQVFSNGNSISRVAGAYLSIVSEQFKKVGLSFKVVPTQKKFPTVEDTKESPLRFSGIVSDYVDPLIMFAWLREGGFNEMYHPPQDLHKAYQDIYNEASNAESMTERVETVKKLSEFVRDNSLVIALTEERGTHYVNPKTVETLGDQSQPLTLFLKNVRLKSP